MNYFILGSNPALSIAEIAQAYQLAPEDILLCRNDCLITRHDMAEAGDINRLGGTVKIGRIVLSGKELSAGELAGLLPERRQKTVFGFSNYTGRDINEKKLGMELKKALTDKGGQARWVDSKERTLSSVVVEENDILRKGAEFCFFRNGDALLVGQTLSVQPFKALSRRDYDRPFRDDFSGMLPPKLAMIMLNLSGAQLGQKIIDPFCGSGTIVNEALLLGYSRVFGTDLSRKAVRDSEENYRWLKSKYPDIAEPKLQNLDARKLSAQFSEKTFDAIVTEPFLGPQRGKRKFGEIKNELERLYTEVIREFSRILKDNGRVVMVWPYFRADKRRNFRLEPEFSGFRILNPLNNINFSSQRITGRDTVLYGRPQQTVWREIVAMEKT